MKPNYAREVDRQLLFSQTQIALAKQELRPQFKLGLCQAAILQMERAMCFYLAEITGGPSAEASLESALNSLLGQSDYSAAAQFDFRVKEILGFCKRGSESADPAILRDTWLVSLRDAARTCIVPIPTADKSSEQVDPAPPAQDLPVGIIASSSSFSGITASRNTASPAMPIVAAPTHWSNLTCEQLVAIYTQLQTVIRRQREHAYEH